MKRFGLSLIMVVVCLLFSHQYAQASSQTSGKVLVRWKGEQRIHTISVTDVPAVVNVLKLDSRVDHVEADVARSISVIPNDPDFSKQINNDTTHLEIAWDTTTGSDQVVIAVLDTGLDMNHPDLVDNIWTNPNEVPNNGIDDDNNGYVDDVHGWDFVENDNDPDPTPTSSLYNETVVIHGTHVAGLIGAVGNNTIGVTGVNWTVQLMPLRVFDDQGNSSVAAVLDAISYATANGAKVMNMSYGGQTSSQFEADAIAQAATAGVLSVAAAGNESVNINSNPEYPACYDEVIGVGATDSNDQLASFSNYGSNCVDLAAPGDTIFSTLYNDGTAAFPDEYGYLSGTSMATPVVSGTAGLLLAIHPDLTPEQLTTFITSSADDISIPELGAGRVNVAQAIAKVLAALQPNPVATITAYQNSKQKKIINNNTRSTARAPYFTWKKPSAVHDDVVGYYVQWGDAPEVYQTKPHYQAAIGNSDDVVYRLSVVTVDSQGRLSDVTSFRYRLDTIIPTPTKLAIQSHAGGNQLAWQAPKHQHAQSYIVYRSIHAQKGFRAIAKNVSVAHYRDTNIQPQHTYYYKVRAIDDLGNQSVLSAAKHIRL